MCLSWKQDYYEEAGVNVQWFRAALESAASHSRQYTALHVSAVLGPEVISFLPEGWQAFLKLSQICACQQPHTVIHCNRGLPTTTHNHREISANAKDLLPFHDHNGGKTCYKLQFQFICITYSVYYTFLALPFLIPWMVHAHLHMCVKWDIL